MSESNPYENLLDLLLTSPNNEAVITMNVSVDALRKGLRRTIKDRQAAEAILEIDSTIPSYVSVTAIGDDKVKVSITEENTGHKFVSKFQFKLLESTDSKESTNDSQNHEGGETKV